jgi:transposase
VCVGLDTHKARIAVAVAEPGRAGEVRFQGEIANRPDAVRRLIERLANMHGQLRVCYEAGPCGYGLQRQITALGHACTVVAPSLVPRKPGERVKTNRRDAVTLARLHRAGELTPVTTLHRSGLSCRRPSHVHA